MTLSYISITWSLTTAIMQMRATMYARMSRRKSEGLTIDIDAGEFGFGETRTTEPVYKQIPRMKK